MSEQPDNNASPKDYRVTVKVRNNRLLAAIEASGGTMGNKWCEAHGLSYGSVNLLVNMTASPLLSGGELSTTAERLCAVLGKSPEDLWSNEQLYPLERNFSELDMDHAQVVALLPREEQSYLPDFSEIDHGQARKLLSDAMSTLTMRERDVLRMLFHDGITIRDCGLHFNVTCARIIQIKDKALRKMRRSPMAGSLASLIGVEIRA